MEMLKKFIEYWASVIKQSKEAHEFVLLIVTGAAVVFAWSGWHWDVGPIEKRISTVVAAILVARAIVWLPFKKHQELTEKHEKEIKGLRDELKSDSVDLRVELLPVGEGNRHFDNVGELQLYCHHMRVRVLTGNRAAQNCKVWLKEIIICNTGRAGQPNERIAFQPVPLEWQPSEDNRQERTFAKEQRFDLGQTFHNPAAAAGKMSGEPDGFRFTIDRSLGATENHLKTFANRFVPGAVLEFALFATADNYHKQTEFKFRIQIKQNQARPGTERGIETSEITTAD